MARSGSAREQVAWWGAVGLGAWLSVRLARWLAESLPRAEAARGAHAAHEPVREVVEEVLAEHRADDTPMRQAFEQALDEEGAEEAQT